MDTTAKVTTDEMKQDLLAFPKRATEYDETWKRILRLFPKIDFRQIRKQEQWDQFFEHKIVNDPKAPKLLQTFRFKAIEDPLLWLRGPISQDQQVQDAIAKYLSLHPEETADKKKQHDSSHGLSHLAIHEQADNQQAASATPPAEPPIAPKINKQAPLPSQNIAKNVENRPEAPFLKQAKELLEARHPGKVPSSDDIQLLAYQLRRNAMSGERFQQIKEHAQAQEPKTPLVLPVGASASTATSTPQPISPPTPSSPPAIVLANKSGNVLSQNTAPQTPSSFVSASGQPLQAKATSTAITPNPDTSPAQNLVLPPRYQREPSAEPAFIAAPLIVSSTLRSTSPPPPPPSNAGGSAPSSPSAPGSGASGGNGRAGMPPGRGGFGLPGLPGLPIPGLGNLAGKGAGKLAQRAAPLVLGLFSGTGLVIAAVVIVVVLILILTLGDSGDVPEPEVTLEHESQDYVEVENPDPACTAEPEACAEQTESGNGSSNSNPISQNNSPIALGNSSRQVLGSQDNKNLIAFGFPIGLKEWLERIAKQSIIFKINVSFTGQADDVRVTYPINPAEAVFLTASGKCKLTRDSSNRVTLVEWSLLENQGVEQSSLTRCTQTTPTATSSAKPNPSQDVYDPQGGIQGVSTQKIDISKYFGSPYYLPQPKGSPTVNYSQEQINNANTLGAAIAKIQPYLLKKLPATHTDPFLSVMWTMAIEGSGADPYFWNCNETSKGKQNISKGCRGWYNSGNWQVGYGIQVAQAGSHLAEDFKEIYGSSDASKVQEVGNRVIKGGGITNPSTMPAKSVEQLVQEAGRPDTIFQYRPTTDTEAAAQQAIAILLMDPQIGAASIAQEVAADIGSNWAQSMRDWHQDYYTNGLDPNNPTFSNNIKLLAEKYTGEGGGGGIGGGGKSTFSPVSFRVKILPLKSDHVFESLPASADVIGGVAGPGGSTATQSGTTTVSGDISKLLPSQIPPDPGSASSIKQQILQHFKNHPELINFYKQASGKTGIPWQVFAGMHWREGDAVPGLSLTSGRRIGTYEPDRAAAGDCVGPVGAVDGKADTNCAYANEVDDIMFAADHLIGKINKVPSSFQDIVQALSRYNGTGNENCGRSPYSYCPPSFTSEDSAYTLNYFDNAKHAVMYMIYCSDGALCGYGTRDGRPGALTVTKWVAETIK